MRDLSQLPAHARAKAAERVRLAADFELGDLPYFRSEPCADHESPEESCIRCGVILRKHQRVGAAWLYLAQRGLLADMMGVGKTVSAAALLALLKDAGELEENRALIVPRSGNAVLQWKQQLTRMVPKLAVATALGIRNDRRRAWAHPWDVMLISAPMLLQDHELLDSFPLSLLMVDDVDALRHRTTQTSYVLKRLARDCPRVVVLSGTPLQKKLVEMHSILEMVGGREVLGSKTAFEKEYVRQEKREIYIAGGRKIKTYVPIGYQNLGSFKKLIAPLTLRRTTKDLDDVTMPAVSVHDVFLDLHPEQKKQFDFLRKGTRNLLKQQTTISQAKMTNVAISAQKICAGLVALETKDGPKTSAKLDWVEEKIVDGDLSEEKVVVFVNLKSVLSALAARLTKAGVGNVIIWGNERDPELRFARQEQFWNDPECRVLLGTSAIEQSLNLQCARHLVNVDQIMNPARMAQLAGRVRRIGSRFETVYVHNLYAAGTHEEKYPELLKREQAVADAVWDEKSELYEALSPREMLELIGGLA